MSNANQMDLKFKYRITFLGLMIAFLYSGNVFSQVTLSSSTDSVMMETCDSVTSPIGTIIIYNNTPTTITLNWEEINTVFPTTGNTALIIDPIQFPPNATSGSSWVEGNDSTEVVFHIWPDSMTPGDTAIFQIVIYNPADSLPTAQILTVLVYCNETAEIINGQVGFGVSLFPNPLNSTSTILVNSEEVTHSNLFNSQGEIVQEIVMDSGKGTIYRQHLKAGVYFVLLMDKSRTVATEKLIIY